jgi:hypothetical protein
MNEVVEFNCESKLPPRWDLESKLPLRWDLESKLPPRSGLMNVAVDFNCVRSSAA